MTDVIEKTTPEPAAERYFAWFARIAASAGLVWVTVRMAESADAGKIDWISFPAYILLVAFIFVLYGMISRQES